jgi:hypothetical protein
VFGQFVTIWVYPGLANAAALIVMQFCQKKFVL